MGLFNHQTLVLHPDYDRLHDFMLSLPERFARGEIADLALADTDREFVIDPQQFFSKGKNTPFAGRKVFGEIVCTLVDGEIKYCQKGRNLF